MRVNILRVAVTVGMFFFLHQIRAYGQTIFLEGGTFQNIFVVDGPRAFTAFASIEGDQGLFPAAFIGSIARNGERLHFLGVDIGGRTRGERVYAQINLGIAGLEQTTDRLGTRMQFHIGAFVGWKYKRLRLRCGYQHLSNGSKIFGTRRPNHGEDLMTCGVGFKAGK